MIIPATKRHFLIAGLLCLFFTAGCVSPDRNTYGPFIASLHEQHPEMELQDWYKLLHQAAMGNRHLGVEDSEIYDYLLAELDAVEASTEEGLVEYISPDSSVVRLNLRPFKAGGGDPEILFSSMKATWDTMTPSPARLIEYGEALADFAGEGQFGFTREEVDRLFAEKKQEGFPAVHHSEAYEAANKPAYRVLLREFVPQ